LQLVESQKPYNHHMKSNLKNIILFQGVFFGEETSRLIPIEIQDVIPWAVARIFFIEVSNSEKRGFHSHKNCNQAIICVLGSVKIICKDGEQIDEYYLKQNTEILVVPPNIWLELELSDNCVIAVLADLAYSEDDYIRNWDEFMVHRGVK